MKITKKLVAEIARYTKSLPHNGLGETMHFYLRENGTLTVYEDVSGQESYPGETGDFLMSAQFPLTQKDVSEILRYYQRIDEEYRREFGDYQ